MNGPRASTAERPLRADMDFRRYWLARVASIAGSALTYLVMPVLVYTLTGSNFWTGLVTVAESLPYLLFGLFAGAYADRLDRRRIMVAADLANAVLLGSLPVAYLLGVLTPAHVLLASFAAQSFFVLFDAANAGALPTLVGRDRVAGAYSAVFGATMVVELVIPALAGALLVVVAPAPLVTLDVATFLASALLVRAIGRPLSDPARAGAARPRLREDIREGLRFLWSEPTVRVTALIGAAQCFAGGAFVGQLVPWADRVLGVAPTDARLGLLFSAWSLGGLVASMLVPPLVRRLAEARVTLVFLPLSAVAGVLTCLATQWVLAMVGLLCWGVAYLVVAISGVTLRQRITPEPLQSRVSTTARMVSFGAGTPAGAFVGGVLSSVAGPRAALLVGAVVLLVGAVAVWFTPLRRLAREPGGAA